MRRPFASVAIGISLLGYLHGSAGDVRAVSHVFAPFNQLVDNRSDLPGLDPEVVPLIGAPAGVYNAYAVGLDWSPVAGGPYSSEALWAFADAADLAGVTRVYADPGRALNSSADSTPRTLVWRGYMEQAYSGGDPLYMYLAQRFTGSSANWTNVGVAIFDAVRYSTPFSGDTEGASRWHRPGSFFALSAVGTNVPYHVLPFHVDLTSRYELTGGLPTSDAHFDLYAGGFDPNDPLTNLVEIIDDVFFGEFERRTLTLTAGTQYYLVVTGYGNLDYGPYSGSIRSGDPLLPGRATLGLIPEPGTGILLLLGLACRRMRRRPLPERAS